MIGLSLKESTRAAALDGTLSFSVLVQDNRELTLSTAQSSVNGLLSAILAAPADYGRLLDAASTAVAAQSDSALRLSQPRWQPAPPDVRDAVALAVKGSAAAQELAGLTPTPYELTTSAPPSTYLSTWEDSGTISLTDASGTGILISSDGQVDTIPASGDGWQFKTESTFLLPDGTKVTVVPGTPASVLATRGQQQLRIGDLAPGRLPSVALLATGGLDADRAQNDGYVFNRGANASDWSLVGAPLGSVPGSREVVATAPLTNEQVVDVTNVTLSPALAAKLAALGLDVASFDANQDGQFSNSELRALVSALDAAIGGAMQQFDASIRTASAASGALLRLNQFLEKILNDADHRDAKRKESAADDREQLRQIQRDLEEGRAALRASRPSPPAATTPDARQAADVLSTAQVVLNRIESFGDTDRASEPQPESSSNPGPTGSSTLPAENATVSPLARAFRRAERLLSGIPTAQPQSPLEARSLPTELAPAVATLVAASPLPGAPSPAVAPLLSANGPAVVAANPSAITPNAQGTKEATPSGHRVEPSTSGLLSNQASVVPDSPRPTPSRAETESDRPLPNAVSVTVPRADQETTSPPSANNNGRATIADVPPAFVPARPPSATPVLPGSEPSVGFDPAVEAPDGFTREYRRRLDQHFSAHREQTARAQQLQATVREVVRQFVTLVNRDEELRKVIRGDDLSDDQRAELKSQVVSLERDTGVAWGGDATKTADGDARLSARVLNSGMMI